MVEFSSWKKLKLIGKKVREIFKSFIAWIQLSARLKLKNLWIERNLLISECLLDISNEKPVQISQNYVSMGIMIKNNIR